MNHPETIKIIDSTSARQKSSTQTAGAQYNEPDLFDGRPPQAGTS